MARIWYDENAGGYVMSGPGGEVFKVGGEKHQAIKEAYKQKQAEFNQRNTFDRHKNYFKDQNDLFGADNRHSGSSLFYDGAGSDWRQALEERVNNRQDAFGQWTNTGYYEGSTGYEDQNSRELMYRRNNAIEDLARRGYSRQQIADHTRGVRNILNEDPDWSDYDHWKSNSNLSSNWFLGSPQMSIRPSEDGAGVFGGFGSGMTSVANQSSQGGGSWDFPETKIMPKQPQTNPQRMFTEGLFSPENEVMREFISRNLKNRLFSV